MTIKIKAAIEVAIPDVKAKGTNLASGCFEIRVHAGAECHRRWIRSILLAFQKIRIDILLPFPYPVLSKKQPGTRNGTHEGTSLTLSSCNVAFTSLSRDATFHTVIDGKATEL